MWILFQVYGHRESLETTYGEKGNVVRCDRYLDRRDNSFFTDAAFLHHLYSELQERRNPRHLLQRLAKHLR